MNWKIEYWYYIVFAISFAGFQYLEEVIRANYQGNNFLVNYFLGVVPNFFPAIGIPCILYRIIPEIINNPKSSLLKEKAHITVFVFTQVGLILWEIQQIWAVNGTFDWHDILWTIIGGLLFLLLWKYISSKETTNEIEL